SRKRRSRVASLAHQIRYPRPGTVPAPKPCSSVTCYPKVSSGISLLGLLKFVLDFDDVAVAQPEIVGCGSFAFPKRRRVDGELLFFAGSGLWAADLHARKV